MLPGCLTADSAKQLVKEFDEAGLEIPEEVKEIIDRIR